MWNSMKMANQFDAPPLDWQWTPMVRYEARDVIV
jgi:hypothetical protein